MLIAHGKGHFGEMAEVWLWEDTSDDETSDELETTIHSSLVKYFLWTYRKVSSSSHHCELGTFKLDKAKS